MIFDLLKCDPAKAHVRDYVELVPDLTPEKIRDEALDPKTEFKRIRELHIYTHEHFPGVTLISETGDEELLLTILKRAGDDRLVADGKRQPQTRQPEAAPAAPAAQADLAPVPDGEDRWVKDFEGRLAESKTEMHFRQRRSEVELAAAQQQIAGPRLTTCSP